TDLSSSSRPPKPAMSCVPVVDAAKSTDICANCDKQGSDGIKLKNCNACFLVKYCSVDCQKAHRKQHKKACKERAAELKDEKLYGKGHERPEFHFCPICFLAIPMPYVEHSVFYVCCMKMVCNGCCIMTSAQGHGTDFIDCPFCRTPEPENDDEILGMIKKRVAARDPVAIHHLGDQYQSGLLGLEMSLPRAFELWTEAAELGSLRALFKLGVSYYHGTATGASQDKEKGIRYWESAAMQGDISSRHMLGEVELENGNYERAVRHFMISANMGEKASLDLIKNLFAGGHATKHQYAEALKGYQDAVGETKSTQRNIAMRLESLAG
ncbi:hypothetical protein THAOC_15732, partial [Thalassiosira oceanica]